MIDNQILAGFTLGLLLAVFIIATAGASYDAGQKSCQTQELQNDR